MRVLIFGLVVALAVVLIVAAVVIVRGGAAFRSGAARKIGLPLVDSGLSAVVRRFPVLAVCSTVLTPVISARTSGAVSAVVVDFASNTASNVE